MHILITDSGVGGLSVVAYAERFVRTRGFTEPVRLTFANAAPENDYGYNAMPSRAVKIETFERFLRNVTARFAPDRIYVACNTLSVLLPDTAYFAEAPAVGRPVTRLPGCPVTETGRPGDRATVPVQGIVETGVALLLRELEVGPESIAMIFGTQTTIDAGTYPRLLGERGIDASRIVSQACPGLADTISEDREGTKAAAEIRHWVDIAVAKMPRRGARVVACLACTHYGYRKDAFEAALAEAGVTAIAIDPNERAVDDLFDRTGEVHDVEVEFVTRYAIPQATIDTLSRLLGGISPRTVAALRGFVHVPDLF